MDRPSPSTTDKFEIIIPSQFVQKCKSNSSGSNDVGGIDMEKFLTWTALRTMSVGLCSPSSGKSFGGGIAMFTTHSCSARGLHDAFMSFHAPAARSENKKISFCSQKLKVNRCHSGGMIGEKNLTWRPNDK